MQQSEIQRLLDQAKYKEALAGIATRPPSTWRDTTELRCLRALGPVHQCLQLAKRLYRSVLIDNDPRLNDLEMCSQLRVIALVFAKQGDVNEACKILKHLCRKNPKQASLRQEYALTLGLQGQLDGAELELGNALKLEAGSATIHSLLANTYCLTGRIRRGIHHHYIAATLAPENPKLLQKISYWSNYCDQRNQQNQYQLARLWASLAHPECHNQNAAIGHSGGEARLNIGFVLADLKSQSLSQYILPLITNLDRSKFLVAAYCDSVKPDPATDSVRKSCDTWHNSSRQNDGQLADRVRSDQIDVLVDLSGHCAGNRLGVFAASPAAMQLSWLGYPCTTGLPSITHRISDQVCDPEGLSDPFFSEKILRLSRGYLCYLPSPDAPQVSGRENDQTIALGSFARLAKISERTVDAWAAAMHAVPNSRLHLKRQEFRNQGAINQIHKLFMMRGIETTRLQLSSEYVDHEQHLDQYNTIDIALDTSPYNAVTTALDALWMGVPVVSLSGGTHASRRTASVLHSVGLKTLSVNTVLDFASQVKRLADDFQIRKKLRLTLRSVVQESDLFKHREFADDFGDLIQGRWQQLSKADVETDSKLDQPNKRSGHADSLTAEASSELTYPQASGRLNNSV